MMKKSSKPPPNQPLSLNLLQGLVIFRCMLIVTGFLILTPLLSFSQVKQGERKPFKLAVAQMKVVGGDREANLKHAGEMIKEAADQGAQFILLPEAMDLGWTDPSALTGAEPVPEGKTARFLSEMAKKYQVYICSGLIEKEGKTVYNSAVIIDPQGEVILLHRKINELGIGHPYYALGDRFNVCHTEFGTMGLMICADANTDDFVLTRALAYMGADVILSPSSWAVLADCSIGRLILKKHNHSMISIENKYDIFRFRS